MTYDIRTVGAHPDHWYPLAWSDEIKPGQVIGRRFAGEPIALFRTGDGTLNALEDRCAHRQVPLHLGVVSGQTLKCGYHGWSYDRAGACIDVPYLGECRLPNGVKSYPVREVNGMVLVFPGNPQLAEERLPAFLGKAADTGYLTRRLNREVACHYSFLHENLFDMNHQFLHRKNMGSIKARCLGRRHGETWCEVDYTFSRTEGRQSVGEAAILSAMRPGDGRKFRDLMTIRTEYPYQHLKVWVGEAGAPALDVWLCYTPLGAEQRANRTFGFLSVKKSKIPGLTALAWPFIAWFTERIFQEDKVIVEAEQAAHDEQGADWNNEVFPALIDLRALLVRSGTPPLSQPVGTVLSRTAQN
ncbi:MAG: ferredoxin [Alphaproteobacteria bacterium]|nr:ferredoxin [Alphaproteobacteria bacterium]MDB5739317.1 ferredoxin [Alphaproteobacteria bacterium]